MATSLLKRVWRILLIGLMALAALALAGGLGGAAWNASCDARDQGRFGPPGQLVDIDGLRLHLHCTQVSTGMLNPESITSARCSSACNCCAMRTHG